jgi:hypothetical protein
MTLSNQEDRMEMFKFLNELRESGITNMFGAAPYLVDEFNISNALAQETLVAWMESFGK